jgi:hypothetical protein
VVDIGADRAACHMLFGGGDRLRHRDLGIRHHLGVVDIAVAAAGKSDSAGGGKSECCSEGGRRWPQLYSLVGIPVPAAGRADADSATR